MPYIDSRTIDDLRDIPALGETRCQECGRPAPLDDIARYGACDECAREMFEDAPPWWTAPDDD